MLERSHAPLLMCKKINVKCEYEKSESGDGPNVKQPECEPFSPGNLKFSHNDASYEHNHDDDDKDDDDDDVIVMKMMTKMTNKHTNIMTFQQKCTNARKLATFFSGCLPLAPNQTFSN